MAPLGEGPSSALDSTFGAMLIGVFFAILLQGVLTIQAWNYFANFPHDPMKLKLLVCVAWILDAAHTVIICQFIYYYLVTNWGFQPGLVNATPELVIHILFVGLSCFVCQTFFIYRVWILSNKKTLILALVIVPSLVALALNVHLSLKVFDHFSIPDFELVEKETSALYSISALSDVLIAGILCYYLRLSHTRSKFQATRKILRDLVQYVVATGILTSACEIGAAIAFIAQPKALYYATLHFSIGRLYTNSLLASLNARKKILGEHQEGVIVFESSNNSQDGQLKPPNEAEVHILSIRPNIDLSQELCLVHAKEKPSDITVAMEQIAQIDKGNIEMGSIVPIVDNKP